MAAEMKETRSMSLATKTLIGLILGLGAGLFLGEYAKPLWSLGNIFIRLLQMLVLPYITLSLISGFGSLSYRKAGLLGQKAGLVLLLLWGIGILMVTLMPLVFPKWLSASFYSSSMVDSEHTLDIIDLFFPKNFFAALADNVVPGVVFLSMLFGIAVIGIRNKEKLLDNVEVVLQALISIMRFIVRLGPIWVFAIAAGTAGTVQLDEFRSLEIYLLTYVAFWMLLAFWVLPGLVTVLTPLTYSDVYRKADGAFAIAFATGNLLIVLPLIVEKCKKLLQECQLDSERAGTSVEIIVPLSFNFPNISKVMALGFCFFSAWFCDVDIPLAKYPVVFLTGIVTLFGKTLAVMPYLLRQMGIPADMFDLFVISQVILSRFGAMLAALSTLVLCLLGTLALERILRVHWGRLLRYLAVTAVLLAATMFPLRYFFAHVMHHTYTKDQVLERMHLLPDGVSVTVTPPSPGPIAAPDFSPGYVQRIQERGVLRVGFINDALPFAFRNAAGDLVGFDVEMAHELAQELGVSLLMVEITSPTVPLVARELREGYYDVIMSGVDANPALAEHGLFTIPYLSLTLAFVTEDSRSKQFSREDELRKLRNLRVGAYNSPFWLSKARRFVPHADVVPFETPYPYFEEDEHHVEAFFYTAEQGAAWSLLYPAFCVVVPKPRKQAVPLGYPVALENSEFMHYLNTWIRMKQDDGTIERLYDYWILGKERTAPASRWSVLRNVLHWVR